jgi:epoxide hydrolase-like predicted phosphatase
MGWDYMAPIRAVIFDFGRVISVQKPATLFRTYEYKLGIPAGTINKRMFDSQAWKDALIGRKTLDTYWEAIGPELGLKTKTEIDSFRKRYYADEAINQGVLKLIQMLHGRFKLAVLSNFPPGLTQWLSEWEILDYFDVVCCSGDVHVAKPDPAAFELILNKLNVGPEEAIFIDDNHENVKAACEMGLSGILFTTAVKLNKELAELLDGNWRRGKWASW